MNCQITLRVLLTARQVRTEAISIKNYSQRLTQLTHTRATTHRIRLDFRCAHSHSQIRIDGKLECFDQNTSIQYDCLQINHLCRIIYNRFAWLRIT